MFFCLIALLLFCAFIHTIIRGISWMYVPSLSSRTLNVCMTVNGLSFIHTLCQAECVYIQHISLYASLYYVSPPSCISPLPPHLTLAKLLPCRLRTVTLSPLDCKLIEFSTKICYSSVTIVFGMSYELKNYFSVSWVWK